MSLSLVVLAAGMSTRYGSLKQLVPVGPSGEALLDYAIYDAVQAGFTRVVLVIRHDLLPAFQRHMEQRWDEDVDLSYVFQETPAERSKPWGTAHAVLAAESAVQDAFVVSNADDYYGASSYEILKQFLVGSGKSSQPSHALMGYTLEQTLSAAGGVSRAICETGADGNLKRLTEVVGVRRENSTIRGMTLGGDSVALRGHEIVSMNLWGFTPDILRALRADFERFTRAHAGDSGAEFLISTAVNDLVGQGMRVEVLRAPESWMGMTFETDREAVEAELRRLVGEGRYPTCLSATPHLRSGSD